MIKMKYKYINKFFAIIAIALLTSSISFASGVKKKITFKRGEASATVRGSVVRGDRDEYTISARKGQQLRVSITSREDNAVFQIYTIGKRSTLEGAGEGEDATSWTGELPRTGVYTIVVGGTRGNANYTLKVEID